MVAFKLLGSTGLRYSGGLLLVLLCAQVALGISNIVLGIYQRGMVTQTVLPFGLNGIYKWLLQFGLSSMAA